MFMAVSNYVAAVGYWGREMQVCILGSCVSRDIFNHAKEGEVKISLYSARTSLGSVFSPPPFEDIYSSKLKSAFQQRLVSWDINKDTAKTLLRVQADLIVIDNIDERFNLLAMSNGHRCTLSSEMVSTGAAKHPGGKIIPSGSLLFLRYWLEGWEKLVEMLESRGLHNRIVLNKVYCQHASTGGVVFEKERVDRLNETLSKIYDVQERSLSREQIIDYGDRLTCPDDHRWGPTPFHFSNESQLYALEWLRNRFNVVAPNMRPLQGQTAICQLR